MRSWGLAFMAMVSLAAPSGAAETARAVPAATGRDDAFAAATFKGLAFRAIGPALTSGRITDFAVDPARPWRYFVAVASGGVWKTDNDGTTWTPVFDHEGAYSIGCVALDPSNPHTVWVGTGENNSQRSVSWGDGVYRSDDGGKSWRNVGLNHSEHIGKIVIDPRDSRVVYVAAQGPLWGAGGDRGLYKTTDGGATWTAVLKISDNTGVSDVALDPRNPDTLYAAAYQRRRHEWTIIDGGPESAIYKSTDAGKTWRKLTEGLPKDVDLGRIGLAVAPSSPDVVYAIVEAADGKGGFFRSTDRGESWEKRSSYMTTSPQYYNELFCDPKDPRRVYAEDTWLHVTEDGGKTFVKVGEKTKHVDNHAVWIDPADTDHLLVGCDGGVYETRDRGATWEFKANLPVTQFYRVDVDDAQPFYNVYGGTQDNFSLGGPSRTTSINGITNADWFVTTGGDGFVSRVDPVDPAIVYAESQYGGLVRFDRRSGEEVDIKPLERNGEAPYRWNWDSPLIVSPHSHTRLYFAANKLFRSDDRGNSWRVISGELSRGIDRNKLPVMGRVWPIDAVAKNASTSFYGNATTIAESPAVEGLLYVGTDDGVINVTEDDGAHWRRVETFPGVPERTFVSRVTASLHDPNTVYAAFDNHANADFRPYLLRSRDRGRTWVSIASGLPAREVVHAVIEDPVDPALLFAGCEFGVFFSSDSGAHWTRLEGGLPTISVRDLTVQRRAGDLVLATFGRGFYILDDIAPLRGLTRAVLEQPAALFAVRNVPAYIERSPLGGRDKSFQGDAFFTAPNPPFGALLTYHLRSTLKTQRELRHDAEREDARKGTQPPYPTADQLHAEAEEEKPVVVVTVTDAQGHVVRQLTGPVEKGFHRIAWDLRYPPSTPAKLPAEKRAAEPWDAPDRGPMVVPGVYTARLETHVNGATTATTVPQSFRVVPLGLATLKADDQAAVFAFAEKTARLQRNVLGAVAAARDARTRLAKIQVALTNTPAAVAALVQQAHALETRLVDLQRALSGDRVLERHNEPVPPAIVDRVQGIVGSLWATTQAPTATMQQAYADASSAFTPVAAQLDSIVTVDLVKLDAALDAVGAPWTPGRVVPGTSN